MSATATIPVADLLAQLARQAADAGDELQSIIDQVLATRSTDIDSDLGKVQAQARADAVQLLLRARDQVWTAARTLAEIDGRVVQLPDADPLLIGGGR